MTSTVNKQTLPDLILKTLGPFCRCVKQHREGKGLAQGHTVNEGLQAGVGDVVVLRFFFEGTFSELGSYSTGWSLLLQWSLSYHKQYPDTATISSPASPKAFLRGLLLIHSTYKHLWYTYCVPGTEDTVVSRAHSWLGAYSSMDTQAKTCQEVSGDRVESGPLRLQALPAHVLKALGFRNPVPAPSYSLAGAL